LLNEHTKKDAGKYKTDLLQAKYVQMLAPKLSKHGNHVRNAAKRGRNVKVKASISMSVN